jgi:ATP synthase protein I
MAREPTVSPWAVVAVQFLVGIVVALVAWGVTGRSSGFWSALYGAAVVVLPAALMARGIAGRLISMSPVISAVGVMVWEMVKVAATVTLLVAAPGLVPQLSWPALLATLSVCMSVYWFALLWRGRPPRAEQARAI